MYYVKGGNLFAHDKLVPGVSDITQFDIRFGKHECILAVNASGNVLMVYAGRVLQPEGIGNVLGVNFGEYPMVYIIMKNGSSESMKIREDGNILDRAKHNTSIDLNWSSNVTITEDGHIMSKSGTHLFDVNPRDIRNVFGNPRNSCVLVLHKTDKLHTYIDYCGSYVEAPVVNNVDCIPG